MEFYIRKEIISHLNLVCIFLGFHSFGLYIHNDTMSSLGRPQDMFSDTAIQLQPSWLNGYKISMLARLA
jgi:photosystem I P700 chlorophyll a apoprotein A1